MQVDSNTSNIGLSSQIESYIENKINQILDVLPPDANVKVSKMIHEYTIYELYEGTIQTVIDIINDVTALNASGKYIDSKIYRRNLLNIFFLPERRIYIGIVLVIISFILYFIDAADA